MLQNIGKVLRRQRVQNSAPEFSPYHVHKHSLVIRTHINRRLRVAAVRKQTRFLLDCGKNVARFRVRPTSANHGSLVDNLRGST